LRDQLLRVLEPARHHALNKIYQPITMRFVLELEVKAIIHVFDVKAFFSCIVLNDELLEE
jgi:hypothetical protein